MKQFPDGHKVTFNEETITEYIENISIVIISTGNMQVGSDMLVFS